MIIMKDYKRTTTSLYNLLGIKVAQPKPIKLSSPVVVDCNMTALYTVRVFPVFPSKTMPLDLSPPEQNRKFAAELFDCRPPKISLEQLAVTVCC